MFHKQKRKKKNMKRLSFIPQLKTEFWLLFTGYKKVLGKMFDTPEGVYVVTQALEGWSTKAKETSSLHEVRWTLLDTNPVFHCVREVMTWKGNDLPWELLPIKSYNTLVKWSFEIIWQTKTIISPLPPYQWQPNLAVCCLAMRFFMPQD